VNISDSNLIVRVRPNFRGASKVLKRIVQPAFEQGKPGPVEVFTTRRRIIWQLIT
jgi:hypothetical protein